MARFKFNKNYSIMRAVKKLAFTLIALWIGGTIVTELGTVMTDECSPFFDGLSLIGWTVNSDSCITAINGSGILVIVGLVGVASVVLEFVTVRM